MDIDGNSNIGYHKGCNNHREFVSFTEYFIKDEVRPMLIASVNADSEEHAIKKTGEIRIRFKHANIFPAHLTDLRTIEGKKFHPSTCEEIII
jgi:hypothetical protein